MGKEMVNIQTRARSNSGRNPNCVGLTTEYYFYFELFQARSWGGWKAWGFRGFQPLSWETPRGREPSAVLHAVTSRGRQCPPSVAEAGRGGAGLRALDPPGDLEF